jgi:quinol monooxygenase YgiN
VIAVGWQFDVNPELQQEFEQFFGADGEWTKLSRRSRSFLGSSFLRDLAQPARYLLIEYWSEAFVYDRHLADYSGEMRQLEVQRERLVLRLHSLGLFNALDVPVRSGPTWSQRTGRSPQAVTPDSRR